MKTLSLEASIELQEYMPEETEFMWVMTQPNPIAVTCVIRQSAGFTGIKTLTLEEAIDVLPKAIEVGKIDAVLEIRKYGISYVVNYSRFEDDFDLDQEGSTLLEAVESMLLHLHREGLLTK